MDAEGLDKWRGMVIHGEGMLSGCREGFAVIVRSIDSDLSMPSLFLSPSIASTVKNLLLDRTTREQSEH